ncbi:MAG: PspA/IM30 family protein [Actinomycetota bacterium]|nr:PspA/IM30 family protein [Actinomycetota bacterium]MDH4016820.1 PspA/IM30 family protein [Actinomycetota bacterium]
MAQESIFGRIGVMTRANINAMLDRAEDPEKMLDQMIRDYTHSIAEAREAVAATIGQLRMSEQDLIEDRQTAQEWGGKALAASQKADQLRAAGQSAEADKFDSLARIALERQLQEQNEAADLEPVVAAQEQNVEKLKVGLAGMAGKLEELKGKRNELVARAKMAAAQNRVQDAVASINLADPTSDLSRFEEKVRREEARAMGNAELAASTLDAQFDSLEDMTAELEIDARLAALKAGGAAALGAASEPLDAEIVE